MSHFRSLRAFDDAADPDAPGVRATHHLHPGEALAARTPTAVHATVSSCVVVFLWDRELRVGGVAHFVLPRGLRNAAAPALYGNLALPRLVDALQALGCSRRRLLAKLFGGSSRHPGTSGGAALGARNVALADELLAELEIPVVARDTGGARDRKLVVHSDDFSAWCWRLR